MNEKKETQQDIQIGKPPSSINHANIPLSQKSSGPCEQCEFYDYDEFDDAYACRLSLDEDEMVAFLSHNTNNCPYFRFYDEYKSVHKQI